jgi:heat shock protein HslJ
MKFILTFFSLCVLKCCGAPSKTLQSHQNITETVVQLNDLYQINSLNGKDVSSFKLTITFNDSTKQVSGFSGCNKFFGSYTLENKILKFGNLASTKMFCDDEANQIETQFLKSLEKADSFSIKNEILQLISDNNIILEGSKEKAQEQLTTIEYTASSRGSYQKIVANKTGISKTKKKSKNPETKSYANYKWETLEHILEAIPLEAIANLEVPSKNFQFDGAPIAKLKISSNGKTYETPSFDHGNPPKEIAELIKELLSISEMIE